MKKIMKNTFLVASAFIFLLTSCVKDLNTLPLNETDATSETAYAEPASYLNGLSYLYGYWALVSQNDMDPRTLPLPMPDKVSSHVCIWF